MYKGVRGSIGKHKPRGVRDVLRATRVCSTSLDYPSSYMGSYTTWDSQIHEDTYMIYQTKNKHILKVTRFV